VPSGARMKPRRDEPRWPYEAGPGRRVGFPVDHRGATTRRLRATHPAGLRSNQIMAGGDSPWGVFLSPAVGGKSTSPRDKAVAPRFVPGSQGRRGGAVSPHLRSKLPMSGSRAYTPGGPGFSDVLRRFAFCSLLGGSCSCPNKIARSSAPPCFAWVRATAGWPPAGWVGLRGHLTSVP
jgi:hypothetical protein